MHVSLLLVCLYGVFMCCGLKLCFLLAEQGLHACKSSVSLPIRCMRALWVKSWFCCLLGGSPARKPFD